MLRPAEFGGDGLGVLMVLVEPGGGPFALLPGVRSSWRLAMATMSYARSSGTSRFGRDVGKARSARFEPPVSAEDLRICTPRTLRNSVLSSRWFRTVSGSGPLETMESLSSMNLSLVGLIVRGLSGWGTSDSTGHISMVAHFGLSPAGRANDDSPLQEYSIWFAFHPSAFPGGVPPRFFLRRLGRWSRRAISSGVASCGFDPEVPREPPPLPDRQAGHPPPASLAGLDGRAIQEALDPGIRHAVTPSGRPR
jgi:hypothetical protein